MTQPAVTPEQAVVIGIGICLAVTLELVLNSEPVTVELPWAQTQTETQAEREQKRECCPVDVDVDDDDDPDPRRLVEVGSGHGFLPVTTFEELYKKYQADFDEFVAVDPSADMLNIFKLQAVQGKATPLRQQMINDPRVQGRRAKLSDLETNYADFLVAIAPGPWPHLGAEIQQGHMDRVAKPGAFIYIALEATTNRSMPNLQSILKSKGYTVKERTQRMSDPASNILGIPIHSQYNTKTWWEIYKRK